MPLASDVKLEVTSAEQAWPGTQRPRFGLLFQDTARENTMEREPQITFKNIATSEALEQLIRERIARLERFHGHIVGVRVVVEAPHPAAELAKTTLAISVEVDIAGRPRIVVKRSEAQHESKGDRYAFMNWAFDAVQRQLEDVAAKQNREVKRHGGGGEGATGPETSS